MKTNTRTAIAFAAAMICSGAILRADDLRAIADALKNSRGEFEQTDGNFAKFRTLLREQREKTRVFKPEFVSGSRVLVNWDADPAAIAASRAAILHTWLSRYHLLDCGGRSPKDVLKTMPQHKGALVFDDGKFVQAIPSADGKRTPEGECAMIRWWSGDSFMSKGVIPLDQETFTWANGYITSSKLPSMAPDGDDGWMKIRPVKDRTLLETFIRSESEFDYAEPQLEFSPTHITGKKVLIAFDPFQMEEGAAGKFERGLKDTKTPVLITYRYGFYHLLDCGDKAPEDIVKSVPFHAGALVFRDGNFEKAIPSHDGKRTPSNYAAKRWGSSMEAVAEMMKEKERLSKTEGIVAKFHEWRPKSKKPEDQIAGNPSWLELRPGKGKTLLEVFLLAQAQFDYPAQKQR